MWMGFCFVFFFKRKQDFGENVGLFHPSPHYPHSACTQPLDSARCRERGCVPYKCKTLQTSGLSVLCMNNDSSLQVGRTWQGGPFANRRRHQHSPQSACEICLRSLISHSRGRAVNSSERRHSHFHNSFLNLQTPSYGIYLPLFKN